MTIATIHARNPNDALLRGLQTLRGNCVLAESRNGSVAVHAGPVVTSTRNVRERVLFSPLRDANPFFHLTEALWMLAGRNEIAPLTAIVSSFGDFSDDGVTMPAAYGHRWRHHFGHDQLLEAIGLLKANPLSRQVVMAMWDPGYDVGWDHESAGGRICNPGDLMKQTKDKPCNTQIYFDATRGPLDMTVTCRSNDAVWGAHGANAVHFSVLHEFVAAATGLQLGTMYQFSNNYHIYTERPDVQRLFNARTGVVAYETVDYYSFRDSKEHGFLPVRPTPLVAEGETYEDLLADCARLFDGQDYWLTSKTRFFDQVYLPMMNLYWQWKVDKRERDDILHYAATHMQPDNDWHVAAIEWIQRRLGRKMR